MSRSEDSDNSRGRNIRRDYEQDSDRIRGLNRQELIRKNRAKRAKMKRRKSFFRKVIVLLIIIAGVLGGAFFMKRYGLSNEPADLYEYYGISKEEDTQNQLAVVIDNEVLGVQGILLNDKAYIEYAVVRDYLNERVYLDWNENILLYTLPEGTIRAEVGSKEYTLMKQKYPTDYVILKMEGDKAYIALDFVQAYSNIEFKVYKDIINNTSLNKVMIVSDWGETTIATIKKDTQVRRRGGVKSPVLTEVLKKDIVTVIEDEDNWKKVRTEDGFIGYVQTSCLKNERTETISREFEEQVYKNISKDYTINMAWHVVTNAVANNSVLETIASTKGLTTISPTWFTVADTKGNLNSIASAEYVNYAHQANIEVWALVRDFDGGISSFEESYQLLSRTSSRENLINQLMAEVLKNDIDGINVDFENISVKCGEHYIQFIRELSLRCRQNGIILSVDNYVPKGYNAHYHLEEQGKVADYVVIMGYDEHHSNSYESGSVASIGFVEDGITKTLKVVSNQKVINAVPFFTRLWKEVPKTQEELEAQAGTEAADYLMKVISYTYGMNNAESVIENAGAKIVFDEETGENFAQWETSEGTYKIWLEDEVALESKLKLMKKYDLAGLAAWRLGYEKTGTWDLIKRYVN